MALCTIGLEVLVSLISSEGRLYHYEHIETLSPKHTVCDIKFHFYSSSRQSHTARFAFSRRVFWCNLRHIMAIQLASVAHKPLLIQKCGLKLVHARRHHMQAAQILLMQ